MNRLLSFLAVALCGCAVSPASDDSPPPIAREATSHVDGQILYNQCMDQCTGHNVGDPDWGTRALDYCADECAWELSEPDPKTGGPTKRRIPKYLTY